MGDDERKPKDRGDAVEVKPAIPKNREEVLKWNGWGYKDSKFFVRGDNIYFTGSRYPISNGKLPHFADWAKSTFGINLNDETDPIPEPPDSSYPSPRLPATTLQRLRALSIPLSTRNLDRLFRAHGHTLHDIYTLRTAGVFERIPDVVVWPRCHDEVVDVVKLADELGLVVIPFGGGTAVSGAAECPQGEERTIVSLDTTQMNRLLWVDKENLLVCCESGIVGQDLERALKGMGYTVGHEPDSYEFSSLGGWVATRASGMKKNTYGNIEDLVVHVKMVTPKGVLTKSNNAPRISCGPDFNHVILGSEGSLGVITEVVLKMRPLPACRKYGSVVFPNFELGVACMREIAKQRCQPASVRLMDNEQFKFGHALKPEKGYFGQILDGISKLYVTKIKGFDVDTLCAMTLLFEGDKTEVSTQEKRIYKIASDFGGFPGGATNGERGYALTFVIAYIRDLAFRFDIVSESFETSVPWDRVLSLCRNVKHCVRKECESRSISHHLICCRVTQTYDAGCVVYFYFAFAAAALREPVKVYESIEEKARDEIIANGGSISHHHGVGKLRRKWYAATVSDVGVGLYVAAKRELDPNDVFATGNLVRAKL